MQKELNTKLSKEQIKTRMLRVASRIWGSSDTFSENQFDPLVAMIFSAVAHELEQVQDDIQVSQSRVLERLAQMLLPDVFTAPQPSHTIVHAMPVETKSILKRNQHLYFKKKISTISAKGTEESKDIFFTPTKDTLLADINIKYVANKKYIYKNINAFDKELLIENKDINDNEPLSIWLGIDVNSGIIDLKGTSLFVEYKNEADRKKFYEMIDMCVCTISSKLISLKKGLFAIKHTNTTRLNTENDTSNKLENIISKYYAQFFLHINENAPVKKEELSNYPAEFEAYYDKTQLAQMKDKLLWLHISYPAVLNINHLPYINISFNCFPVVNRKLNEKTFRLQENLNIIPLSTDDIFLDMVKIFSTGKSIYESGTENNPNELQSGTYSIRHGAVGRFDARNASELLAYMIDLLREESAAFGAMTSDMLQNNLKQLNQLINALQQKLNLDTKRKDVSSFLMIQPRKNHENIFIEYWVTQGIAANGLRQGTSLQLYSNSDLKSGSIYTVKPTSMAKEKMTTAESIHAFKSALLSRNRIVTEQDFRYACFAELGHLIEQVEIKHSFVKNNDTSIGFQKVLQIILFPSKLKSISVDWEYACKHLQLKLEQQSMQVLPLQVILNK